VARGLPAWCFPAARLGCGLVHQGRFLLAEERLRRNAVHGLAPRPAGRVAATTLARSSGSIWTSSPVCGLDDAAVAEVHYDVAGAGGGAVRSGREQQVTGLYLGQGDLGAVLLPLVGRAGDVNACRRVGGEDQAAAVEAARALAAPAVGLAELGRGEGDRRRGGPGRHWACVPDGPGQHLSDIPAGVVVSEDRLLNADGGATAGAVGAHHPRRCVDGVRRASAAARMSAIDRRAPIQHVHQQEGT
jgi:hypothetical protein